MKKLLTILAAVGMLAAVSTSCKKPCECVIKFNGAVVLSGTVDVDNEMTKKECETYVPRGFETGAYEISCTH